MTDTERSGPTAKRDRPNHRTDIVTLQQSAVSVLMVERISSAVAS